jgi:hypothetical protein
MADNVAIEPGFCQQVAAEALKYSERTKTRLFQASALTRSNRLDAILTDRKSRKNRCMKCKAINARTLIRTRTTHLCLDSQFNLAGFIIPIGIDIYDIPGRKSRRGDVSDLRLHN